MRRYENPTSVIFDFAARYFLFTTFLFPFNLPPPTLFGQYFFVSFLFHTFVENLNFISMKRTKPIAYLAPDLRKSFCRIECGFATSIATDDDSQTEQLEWD